MSVTPEDSSTRDESGLLRDAKPAQDGLSANLMRAKLRRRLLDVPAPLKLGRYVLIETIGSGGMGTVYAAYDALLRRKVALKTLRARVHEAPEAILREARALARLTHPNVVAVYEVGRDDEHPYIVMELVDGVDLRTWLGRGPSLSQILARMVEAGRGLSAAHVAGVVHGDFKPENVLVSPGGARVVDFGLARAIASPEGLLGGTHSYMAPECLEGGAPSAASDQYSFAATVFEATCGHLPSTTTTSSALLGVMTSRQNRGRPPPSEMSLPRPIAEAIARGLSPETDERWPSMDAMLEALQWDPAQRRKRLLVSLGGVVVLGLAASTWHCWVAARRAQCSEAEEGLAGIWDDARRTEIQQALLANGAPYATQVWDRAERELDRYAEAWSSMRVEACEATSVRGEQSSEVMDLRMRCLHRAKTELQGVTGVLADADADVVENAHELTSGLPPLPRCADVDALRQEVEPPLPEESEAVEQIRVLLAEAKAARKAGRYSKAQAAVDGAKVASAGVTYGRVHAEVALAEGRTLDKLGHYAAAEIALRNALEFGSRWRQRTLMANAATLLLYQVGYRLKRVGEGHAYAKVALGLTAHEPLLEPDARSSIGSVLKAQGMYSEAETEFRRALALHEEAVDPDYHEIATARNNVGAVLRQQGRYKEAEADLRRAMALWETELGPEHPRVASSRNNLGALFSSQGRYEEAEVELRHALSLQQSALGPEHPTVASARNNLGTVLRLQGKYEEAEAESRRALAVRRKSLGPDHPDIAMSRNALANVLYAQGRYEEAEVEFRRALALWDKTLGPDHPNVAGSQGNLGNVLFAQGRYEEAEAEHRRALALSETALGPDHPSVASSRNNLANALRAQGKSEEAEAEFRRALELWEAALGPDHPNVAASQSNLADLLMQQHRPAEALPLAERAWLRRQRDDIPAENQAEAAFLVARALWANSRAPADRKRARTLAEFALEGYTKLGERRATEAAFTKAWLQDRRVH